MGQVTGRGGLPGGAAALDHADPGAAKFYIFCGRRRVVVCAGRVAFLLHADNLWNFFAAPDGAAQWFFHGTFGHGRKYGLPGRVGNPGACAG